MLVGEHQRSFCLVLQPEIGGSHPGRFAKDGIECRFGVEPAVVGERQDLLVVVGRVAQQFSHRLDAPGVDVVVEILLVLFVDQ